MNEPKPPWHPNPKWLETQSVATMVAFFMSATQTMLLCDDGHEMTLEAAHGRCPMYQPNQGES